jgi:hypothetical protein
MSPVRLSLPVPPMIVSLPELPEALPPPLPRVSESASAEPLTLSIEIRVSLPPQLSVAVFVARLTVTPWVAGPAGSPPLSG